jgi:gluconokinase
MGEVTRAASRTEPAKGPLHVVVMGVSGSGKSTVAGLIAERLGWEFAEGDDFHPPENVEKMERGDPLVDEDRWPWLEKLAAWTHERDVAGESTVVTCSALRKVYRDILRQGGSTFYVHLVGDKSLLLERMESREHFMPPSLLESQLDTLEPLEPDELGMSQDVANPPQRIANVVAAQLDLA